MKKEELELMIGKFRIRFYRVSVNSSNVVFEIQRPNWGEKELKNFFSDRFDKFKKIIHEWIKLHKFFLLIRSYLQEEFSVGDWVLVDPKGIELRHIEYDARERKLMGVIKFTREFEDMIGRPINLEEAKQAFMAIFYLDMFKDGLQEFADLLKQSD